MRLTTFSPLTKKGKKIMAYVVKHWEASSTPNQKGEFVNIKGRQEGWISWILAFVGIDPTVHMVVTERNFHYEERTFWGYLKRSIPISRISEVRDGFQRAWLLPLIFWAIGMIPFFMALGALFNGGFGAFFGMMIVAAIFFGIGYLIYTLWRYVVVGVVGFGGTLVGAPFAPSFIEGKKIDADAAEEVGKIIQMLVDTKS